MAASVDIRDEATPLLKRVTGVLRREVAPAIGAAVVLLFQTHFAARPHNANNWPTTNFWQRAAKSCNYDIMAADVVINVNQQGVRQRLEGGVINAKSGGWLTIPARAEVYGKRAPEVPNLEVAFFKTNHGFFAALVQVYRQAVSFGRQRKDGSRKVIAGEEHGGAVMFWLKKSVKQDADPDVIPSSFEIAAACFSTINGIVARARGGAA